MYLRLPILNVPLPKNDWGPQIQNVKDSQPCTNIWNGNGCREARLNSKGHLAVRCVLVVNVKTTLQTIKTVFYIFLKNVLNHS